MAGWVALEKMVMLVLLMLVGFAAAKAQWVDSAFSQKTSRLVANVFIVATILPSVVGVQPLLTGGEMAVVVAAVFVLFAIAGVLGQRLTAIHHIGSTSCRCRFPWSAAI